MAYAHTPNPAGEWHDLVAHLRGTAELASQFATSFGAADLAARIALWHDLGKFNPEFQQYLAECHRLKLAGQKPPKSKIDHKAAGVKLGLPFVGPIALLIQGHHGGLQQQSGLTDWQRVAPALRGGWGLKLAALLRCTQAGRVAPALRGGWGLKRRHPHHAQPARMPSPVAPALRGGWGLKQSGASR